MKDSQLSELLQSLPREEASPGFTDGVLERLDRRRGGSRARLWVLAASLLAALTLSIFAAREWQYQEEKRQTLAELKQLRAEHDALEQELARVMRLRQEPPMVQLGADEDFEILLDVESLRRQAHPRAQDDTAIRPASFTRL